MKYLLLFLDLYLFFTIKSRDRRGLMVANLQDNQAISLRYLPWLQPLG